MDVGRVFVLWSPT